MLLRVYQRRFAPVLSGKNRNRCRFSSEYVEDRLALNKTLQSLCYMDFKAQKRITLLTHIDLCSAPPASSYVQVPTWSGRRIPSSVQWWLCEAIGKGLPRTLLPVMYEEGPYLSLFFRSEEGRRIAPCIYVIKMIEYSHNNVT